MASLHHFPPSCTQTTCIPLVIRSTMCLKLLYAYREGLIPCLVQPCHTYALILMLHVQTKGITHYTDQILRTQIKVHDALGSLARKHTALTFLFDFSIQRRQHMPQLRHACRVFIDPADEFLHCGTCRTRRCQTRQAPDSQVGQQHSTAHQLLQLRCSCRATAPQLRTAPQQRRQPFGSSRRGRNAPARAS